MDCLNLPLAQAAFHLLAQVTETAGEAASDGISLAQYKALAIFAAVLIVPFLLAGPISRWLRMPDYSTRVAVILLALLASVTVLRFGEIGLGVDLRGGTILVYEIDPTVGIGRDDEDPTGNRIASSELIPSLIKRINPSGTQEIMIRPYGESQIEIIIPEVDQREVDRIKGIIEKAGILRFAILANRRDHQRLIEIARNQADETSQARRLARTVLDVDGETTIGFWALVDREELPDRSGIKPLRVDVAQSVVRNPSNGRLLEIPSDVGGADGVALWMQSTGLENIQVLMSVDPQLDVTGEDLAFAASGFDRDGSPAVRFKLTDGGSGRFLALTTNNAPDGQHRRQLGIVLDDMLLSAPAIQSPISGDGQITGNFTSDEVTQLVRILEAGQLPAALTKAPIAENQIDATLGADTIRKGLIAISTSLVLVLIFILFYYRFIGLIACAALILNLVMILAVMILINQPLTLPGLAGLVLTVGMSVDANVLIFERIREELKKGSAPRMAIRNGFARATTTIIDANLTTLITAIVLYAIGTDQIRGFAVTLILGILFSMFTAIYMSRTFFDIAERKKCLSLSMSDMVNSLRLAITGGGGFDFMRKGSFTLMLSGLLIAASLAAIIARGGSILDIDFAGGSSVTFRVQEPTTTDTVREIVGKSLATSEGPKAEFTVNNVSLESALPGTIYKVDSSIESVNELKELIGQGFAADGSLRLMTYELEILPSETETPAGAESEAQSYWSGERTLQFVAARAQDESEVPAEGDVPTSEDAAVAEDAPVAEDAAVATEAPAADGDQPLDGEPNDSAATSVAIEPEQLSWRRLRLGIDGDTRDAANINARNLLDGVERAAGRIELPVDLLGVELRPFGEGADQWVPDSDLRFGEWEIGLPVESESADDLMASLQRTLGTDPIWISSSNVGSRVAGDMIGRAAAALFASLLCVIAYIWFRFQRVIYGLAAVAALVHDVVITLGAIAVSYWVAGVLGFLLIDQFKISLTVVAALLTVVGYSLNDTIVVFDRIRETKGKSPRLTGEMINTSINATLSRTLLTSLTTLIVVGLLYFFGGEGIHAFAFCLVLGVFVGTYSSIFVASPILLWLVTKYQPAARSA